MWAELLYKMRHVPTRSSPNSVKLWDLKSCKFNDCNEIEVRREPKAKRAPIFKFKKSNCWSMIEQPINY